MFLFDTAGALVAASAGAGSTLARHAVGSLDDLWASLRTMAGHPLTDTAGSSSRAVDPLGRPVDVRVEALSDPEASRRFTLVRLEPLDDAPAALIQRALGDVLAHELRTPLTTIYGGAQLGYDRRSSEATRIEAAETVAHEAQRLHDVIENLVVLARFDGVDEAELEPILLSRVVANAAAVVRGIHPLTGIEVDLPKALPVVRAVPRHAEHAVRNLLSSAADAAGPDGTVLVTGRRDGRSVEVAIGDDGPAYAEAELPAVFDLFAHSSRAPREPSGANLGLFVAHRLVDAMGGRVRAVARDHGAEIRFSLPAAD
jgi:signal transduction histidine kinase